MTGVATGNLGTAANLDETQVIPTEDLRAPVPAWLEDDDPQPEVRAGIDGPAQDEAHLPPRPPDARTMIYPAGVAPARAPASVVEPSSPASARASPRRRSAPRVRQRGLALFGAGVLAALVLVAGAGVLSQLDFGAAGAGGLPTAPALEDTTKPPAAETPAPRTEGGKGKGHGTCHGRHCG